jgi:hypothetical protein
VRGALQLLPSAVIAAFGGGGACGGGGGGAAGKESAPPGDAAAVTVRAAPVHAHAPAKPAGMAAAQGVVPPPVLVIDLGLAAVMKDGTGEGESLQG